MIINWDILKKSVLGTLSLRERQELEQWLAESESHRNFYETVRKHYAEPVEKLEPDDSELDASWQRFTLRAKHKSGRLMRLRAAAACAAAVAVMLGAWALNRLNTPASDEQPAMHITAGTTQAILSVGDRKQVLLSGKEQDNEWEKFVAEESTPTREQTSENVPPTPEQIRIEIPKGGEYRLRLSDGTMVWLNSETVIVYPSEFVGEGRAVTLSGEAFFDVAHNPSKPFTITTADQLEITVLGTRFNVSNYLDVDRAQVTLVEGALSVADGDQKVLLQPSQQAVFDRTERTLSLHDVEDPSGCCAWTNGMFDFKLQPLGTILDAISKWYDIRIVCDPAAVDRFTAITLQCDRRSDFTHVMEILQEVTDLHYRAEGKTVYITF